MSKENLAVICNKVMPKKNIDVRGYHTEFSYFDENGKPALSKMGYAKQVIKVNNRGEVLAFIFYDTEEKEVSQLISVPVIVRVYGIAAQRMSPWVVS